MYFTTLPPSCLAVSHCLSTHLCTLRHCIQPALLILTVSLHTDVLYDIVSSLHYCTSLTQHTLMYFTTLSPVSLAVSHCLSTHLRTLRHCLQPALLFLTVSAHIYVLYDIVSSLPSCFSLSQNIRMYFTTLHPACLAVSHCLSTYLCTLRHCLQPAFLFLSVSAHIYIFYDIVSSLSCCFSLSQHTLMYFTTLPPVCLFVSHCLSTHLCTFRHCLQPAFLFLTVSAYIYVLYDTASSLPCRFSLSHYTLMYFTILSPACFTVSHCLSTHLCTLRHCLQSPLLFLTVSAHIYVLYVTVSSLPCCFSLSQNICIYFTTLHPACLAVFHCLSTYLCTLRHCLQPAFLFLTVSAHIYILYNIVPSLSCCFSLSQHTFMYFTTLSPVCLAVSHCLSTHLCTLRHCLLHALLFLTVSAHIYVLFDTASSLPCCFSLSQHRFMYFTTLSPGCFAVFHCLSTHLCTLRHCLQPALLFLTVSAHIYLHYDIASSLPCCFSLSQHTLMYFKTLFPVCLAVYHCLSTHLCTLRHCL